MKWVVLFFLVGFAVGQDSPMLIAADVHSDAGSTNRSSYLRKQAQGCPSASVSVPAKSANDDFVELTRTTCYGNCPAYSVRIDSDGEVTWRGVGYVRTRHTRHARIDPERARSLIEEFRTPDFWSLCRSYSKSLSTNPVDTIRVQLGADVKEVSDYAQSGPALFVHLARVVDDVSDTHRWRHGNPDNESFYNISREWLPKPGLNPLLKAAINGDVKTLEQLLKSGADPESADASGWTALMYAAAVSSDYPVQILLQAGADPNHASPRGETPLMAAAMNRMLDDDLLLAGADINARNKEGQTALMILAAKAENEEIERALKAGANPRLKDRFGHNALDYLKAANCGKNPVADAEFFSLSLSRCNAVDRDDFTEAKSLLVAAMERHKK